MAELPSGTVTFLFTDLEGSTRLWQADPRAMPAALARHDEILRAAIADNDGQIVKTTGDGFHAVFVDAACALMAAIDAQRVLADEAWSASGELRVRMGLHSGAAEFRGGDYPGPTVNKAARVMGVANGAQVLVSGATAELVRDGLGSDIGLMDLGEHWLRDLSEPERLFQVRAPGLRWRFAPLASLDTFPGNLPLQVSSFIGRESDLKQATAALDSGRIVTLTGVGGVGKTRLALQIAAEMLPLFREGAWLVELAAVRDPDGLVDAFAATFGITARRGRSLTKSLIEFLGTKQLLLVVDNCEHVLDPVAALIEDVARSCPGVVVLATSREGLAVVGERILAVPPLPGPAADADLEVIAASEAVLLFVDRAIAVDSTFALAPDNAAAVVRICRRLDGVPLAIELAAARVNVMNPSELAAALDQHFDVLAGGRRGAVKRHKTLRETIDWSYDLLTEPQQRLLARMSVFTGGCTREAAEVVCADDVLPARSVFALLSELVDRSVVVADTTKPDTRYRLLETIREYGQQRLADHHETDTLRERHAHWYAAYSQRCQDGIAGPDQVTWGKRAAAERDNLLAAMNHAFETGNVDLAVALVVADVHYGAQIGLAVRVPVERVLTMPEVQQHTGYPLVLMSAAFAALNRGESDLADELGDAALAAEHALSGPPGYTTNLALHRSMLSANTAMVRGHWSQSAAEHLDAAAQYQDTGSLGPAAACMSLAAVVLCLGGRRTDAKPIATEGLALARTSAMPSAIAMNLIALAMAVGDNAPERARALLHEASDLSATLDYESAAELTQMTLAAATLTDWPLSARLSVRAIRYLHWQNDPTQLGGILNIAARVLCDTDAEAAATILGVTRTLASTATQVPNLSTTGLSQSGSMIFDLRRETTQHLSQHLGQERLRELRDHGMAMDTDQAIAYTLSRLNNYLTHTNN